LRSRHWKRPSLRCLCAWQNEDLLDKCVPPTLVT
jgi:hypothetical protein